MGIPKFIPFLKARYPCAFGTLHIGLPENDYFFIDLNGIIHMFSSQLLNLKEYSLEDDSQLIPVFDNILKYVQGLIELVKPKKSVYISVDGVAPRAKMVQQRARRFQARKGGRISQTIEKFDSNCISPGTEFMIKLDKYLKTEILNYLLQKSPHLSIYYSNHMDPGEGEHKIMGFLRYLRASPEYDVKSRHCVYGPDSDWVILGLCIHEPNFVLIREESASSKYQKLRKGILLPPQECPWSIIFISLLRDYINVEFESIKPLLQIPYDLERLIDDWVLISCFGGNDFIPAAHGMYIGDGSIGYIINTYKQFIVTQTDYIQNAGDVNFERLIRFVSLLAEADLNEQRAENEWFTGSEDDNKDKNDHNSDSSSDLSHLELDEEMYNYYTTKLGFAGSIPMDLEIAEMCKDYICTIQWIMWYYYRGCVDWHWIYRYHYPPYLTSIAELRPEEVVKCLMSVLKPNTNPDSSVHQLLAILPPQSSQLVPDPFKSLISHSSLSRYYVNEFTTDKFGRKDRYEAIVLLPFVNHDILDACINEIRIRHNIPDQPTDGCFYFFNNTMINQVNFNTGKLLIDPCGLLHINYRSEIGQLPMLSGLPFRTSIVESPIQFSAKFPYQRWKLEVGRENLKTKSLKEIKQKFNSSNLIYCRWPFLISAKVLSVLRNNEGLTIDGKTFNLESMGKIPYFDQNRYEIETLNDVELIVSSEKLKHLWGTNTEQNSQDNLFKISIDLCVNQE